MYIVGGLHMKWFALFIITVGLGFLFFPYLQDQYASYQMNNLINQFEKNKSAPPPSISEDNYHDVNRLLQEGSASNNNSIAFPITQNIEQSVYGTLEISSINLKLPILEGTTVTNLKFGVGHMSGTGSIGNPGNAALAAHRAYRKGKLFNRLNEVEKGDRIVATINNGQFNYIVENTLIVTPDNLDILKQPKDQSLITLITCEPIHNPTHRLIVQAALSK